MNSDLNNMSKEELIKLVLEAQGQLIEKDRIIAEKTSEIEDLQVSFRDMRMRMEQLIAKYEEVVKEKRAAEIRPFLPKTEKLKEEDRIINEFETVREKKKRRSPSETFLDQLKKAYRGEEDDVIVDYDFEANGISKENVKLFGQDETYKLEYIPGSFKVKRVLRNKYRDSEHIYEAVELLEPLYDKLFEKLLHTEVNVIHIDETPLQVINDEKTKCYMFVYTTSLWEPPVYIYSFSDTRSTKETKDLLKEYNGYVICDAYSGYDSLPQQGIRVQRCMVHARRYFNDCLTGLPDGESKKSPAYKTLELMGKLFHHEDKFRKKKYTAERIRQERNKPYYLNCIEKLNRHIESIEPGMNTALKKAVNYYNNNRKELYTYLENGYVDISNNLAERAVKPFVIARKSFLFCKTADGADVTAKLFSIVQTARANGLKAEQYLSYCLENIRSKPIEDLLPWNDSIPQEILIREKDLVKKK